MRQSTRDALELLIEKAQKLDGYNFARKINQASFSWSDTEDGDGLELSGPNEEETDAFVLTIRFFIEKKEHSSFAWLARNVLDDPELSVHWKNEFNELRDEVNSLLDSLPPIRISLSGESPMSWRDILNMFLYSDLSHASYNSEQRERYKNAVSDPVRKGILLVQFQRILFMIYVAARTLANISTLYAKF